MPPMNIIKNLLMVDSVEANKFHLFSSTVTNLLYENVYLEINRLYSQLLLSCFSGQCVIFVFLRRNFLNTSPICFIFYSSYTKYVLIKISNFNIFPYKKYGNIFRTKMKVNFFEKITHFINPTWKVHSVINKFIVYYISNEYNRNAGLTVDRCGLIVSIYIAIP